MLETGQAYTGVIGFELWREQNTFNMNETTYYGSNKMSLWKQKNEFMEEQIYEKEQNMRLYPKKNAFSTFWRVFKSRPMAFLHLQSVLV